MQNKPEGPHKDHKKTPDDDLDLESIDEHEENPIDDEESEDNDVLKKSRFYRYLLFYEYIKFGCPLLFSQFCQLSVLNDSPLAICPSC